MTKRPIRDRGARGSSKLKTGDDAQKSRGKAGIFKPSCVSLDENRFIADMSAICYGLGFYVLHTLYFLLELFRIIYFS